MINNRFKFLLLTALSQSISYSSEIAWPDLDSSKNDTHKLIVSSILGREGEDYKGGKYKGNFFVLQGNGIDSARNSQLIIDLPALRRDLKAGKTIHMKYTTENASNFEIRARYEIKVDGVSRPYQFVLYNKAKLPEFAPFLIPRVEVPGVRQTRIGHGGCQSPIQPENISQLIHKYKDHPILAEAFTMMEGADLARLYDQKLMIEGIRSHPSRAINKTTLLTLMRKDRDLITQAAASLQVGNDAETKYLPFIDQLHACGNQGRICGHTYVGRKGIDGAIELINRHPSLLNGDVSEQLLNLKGLDALKLKIALFYIHLMKKKLAGESIDLTQFKTFCPGKYFGKNKETILRLLSQTSFCQNGVFYAPENGYIKNGNVSLDIPENALTDYALRWEEGRQFNNHKMIFTDCSGFAQFIARQFHPDNNALQDKRQMSYQLAAVYDALANEIKGTAGRLYNIAGRNFRPLSNEESERVTKYSTLTESLRNVYQPVLNPLANIQPGDLIIERGSGEGHVMIVVEQDQRDPTRVTIIELTGFGDNRGYRWRTIKLKQGENGGTCHRVLRIKR